MTDRKRRSRSERTDSKQEPGIVLEFRRRTSLAPGEPLTADFIERWAVEIGLDETERRITRFLYCGEGDIYAPCTPEETSARFGISIEEVEAIEHKIALKMHHVTNELDDLYPHPIPDLD